MIRRPTVFITGAGASCHYGYPTGEELVSRVIGKAEHMRVALKVLRERGDLVPCYVRDKLETGAAGNAIAAWSAAESEVHDLSEKLGRANPTLIDSFLGFNKRLQSIGKTLVAWVILEAEAHPSPPRERENWCRYLVQRITSECETSGDLLRNNVVFVTFNYDVSLEAMIYDGLSAHEFFQPADIDQFVNQQRFLHVYGSVRSCPPIAFEQAESFFQAGRHWNPGSDAVLRHYVKCMDAAYAASQRISTISPDEKDNNVDVITAARNAIRVATFVYVLGYGFDARNSERLELDRYLREPDVNEDEFFRRARDPKRIMLTNFQDRNQVNKRVSKILFGRSDKLLAGQSQTFGDVEDGYYVEKSIRRAYEAMALDFDDEECADW